jgi:hypothetical protein
MLEQLFIGSFIIAVILLVVALYRYFKINKQNEISHQLDENG